MRPEAARARIAAMGTALGPAMLAEVYALYAGEQAAAAWPRCAEDVAYGAHPRQRLDLYAPEGATGAPVLLWVHGGGFLRGDKRAEGVFNANVGSLAARAGLLGAVMNYRLVPDAKWPSGGEDVGLAVDWLAAHAARHGGDPARIVLAGTSAGAVHVATHLMRRAGREGVRGAVLLSGLYGVTPPDERDLLYLGAADPAHATLDALAHSTVPLFVSCAEHDPSRFQRETLGLLARCLDVRASLPRATIAIGHNHYSAAYHLGGGDTRLTDEILAFVREVTGAQQEDIRHA